MRIYILLIFIAFMSCGESELSIKENLEKEAYQKFNDGNYEQSLVLYNKLIEDYGNDIEYILGRAKNKYELKDYLGVIEDCTLGIKEKESANFYSLRGQSYEQSQEYEKAISDYDNALRLNPKLKKSLNNRGLLYLNMGAPNKALIDIKSAIILDDNNSFFYNNLGLVYENLEQYDSAIVSYNKSIEIDNSNPLTYFNRAVCLMYMNKYREALKDLDFIKDTYVNDNGIVSHNKAISHYSLKEFSLACENWKLAMDLGNKDALYYYNKVCIK